MERASSSSWIRPAAGLVRSFMGSVGVFDFDEGNISELLVGPCKSDAPFRGKSIGVDGVSPDAVQFVVMKRMKCKEILLGRMMKNHEAFLRFIEADVAQLFGFFPRQVIAAEKFFREWVGEAFNHRCQL